LPDCTGTAIDASAAMTGLAASEAPGAAVVAFSAFLTSSVVAAQYPRRARTCRPRFRAAALSCTLI